MYDIIIVGAGPAGLTASIYGIRAGKKILVIEAKSYGGQIVKAGKIENYPTWESISGFEFATKLYNQAINLGVQVLFEKVVNIENNDDIKKVITTNNTYETKTIILATGSENRKLGLANEKELTGKGISYCATCDGAFYKNKTVAIIGSNDNTIEDAIYLSDIAKKVYLINTKKEFKGELVDLKNLDKKDNIQIFYGTSITKINGNDYLESIDLSNNENLKIDGLFICIGRNPENENFTSLVKSNNFGYYEAKEDCNTNIKGIFAAGDARCKEVRQLTTAVSDGTIAAIEAIKYINNIEKESK